MTKGGIFINNLKKSVSGTFFKAVNILNLFTSSRMEISVAEIAQLLNIPKTTIYRLVNTMEQVKILEKNVENSKYRLGFKLFEYGKLYKTQIDLRKIALPYMRELSKDFDETVSLNILKEEKRVCIECIESSRLIRSSIHVGLVTDIIYGASERAMFAFLSLNQKDKILTKLPKSEKTIIENRLNKVLENGYAFSSGERTEDSCAISCPIFNSNKEVVASISVSAPVNRMNIKIKDKMIKKLVKVSKIISMKNGLF